jgi:IS5 family transposase
LRLDQIINLKHELVTMSKMVWWSFIETKCGEVYAQGPGMPSLPSMVAPHAATWTFAIAIKH